MYFDQKIKYLDYLENGIRVRGAGFIRLECWGKTCSLIIQASGLFENAKGSYPVVLVMPEKEEQLSELQLQNGKGRLELRNLNSDDLKELEKVRIPLGETRQLVAVLREEADRAKKVQHSETQNVLQSDTQGIASENLSRQTVTGSVAEGMYQEKIGHASNEKMSHPNEKQMANEMVQQMQEENMADNAAVQQTKEEREADGELPQPVDGAKTSAKDEQSVSEVREVGGTEFAYQANLRPGKWEQLIAIYPPITPFGDARQYLQISPGDFVILKDRSYRMVNNSFLLHGYFTYRHLILHRQNRRGEMAYYVGVPGRYYDREKEVAILFGFESFEGAQEPAREGDFGYYMMRVEL